MAALTPQQLNKLFVLLHRSLLQYVGECWPWTAEDSRQTETLNTLRGLVAKQKQNETLLGEPLIQSGWVLDFGGYPTMYTDLHFVALSYLLKQIVISETQIVAAFDAAAKADPESPLLQQIADSEREILKAVQTFVTAPATIVHA